MAAITAQNYLGKCKEDGCGYVIFATAEDIREGDTFRDVTAGTGVYRVNNANWARCTNRHRVFAVKPVKGTYSEKHQCDSRCLNAKGWDCTCSCGGANHGRGHVATVVEAAALPAKTELRHLGEVGKHITGTVIVDALGEAFGKTEYTFKAVNGGHVIKWIAPEYADPQWPIGKQFTLRAKVKAHKTINGNPVTTVTYAEEV